MYMMKGNFFLKKERMKAMKELSADIKQLQDDGGSKSSDIQ